MKVKLFTHENVDSKGSVEGGGGVGVKREVKVFKGTACNCATCNNEHDFIVINKGRNPFTKQVKGTTLFFESTQKLESYVDELEDINDLLYFE